MIRAACNSSAHPTTKTKERKMQKLSSLIAKYTKPPYNRTVEQITEWYSSHRKLANKASAHKKKTKRITG